MVIFLPEIIDINRVDQIGKKKINVQTFTNMSKLRKKYTDISFWLTC